MKAWSALKAQEPLQELEFELPDLGADQVQVRIEACGVCASDCDALNGLYGDIYRFPMVPGHEGVGVITRKGALVSSLKVGDRVGLGVYRNTCQLCEHCVSGNDNLCAHKEMMFAQNYGCFSDLVQISHRYAFKIPENITSAEAAPLMCAGVTTFAPFVTHSFPCDAKIGVLGIGGLGHLALQFAYHQGLEVFALSQAGGKEDLCKSLGAQHFVNLGEEPKRRSLRGALDAILVTASGKVDWSELLSLLGPNGKIIIMGVVKNSFDIAPVQLILGQKSICGSAAGSSHVARKMLQFAALHNIRPMIETFPFRDVNAAIKHTLSGKAKFRTVLTR